MRESELMKYQVFTFDLVVSVMKCDHLYRRSWLQIICLVI